MADVRKKKEPAGYKEENKMETARSNKDRKIEIRE